MHGAAPHGSEGSYPFTLRVARSVAANEFAFHRTSWATDIRLLTRSYVPLVARQFLTGRGYLDEAASDPEVCDLAKLMGMDELGLTELRNLLSAAVAEGRCLILVGYEVGGPARQTVDAKVLDTFCRELKDPASGIWLDTVGTVGKYVYDRRG